MNNDALGRRIADARRAQGLSQSQLARALTVAHMTVSRWERGVYAPTVRIVPTLAKLLGLKPSELMRRPTAREPSRADTGQ